jgi:hypothetical protein
MSRLGLGLTQPPIQWVPGFFPGIKQLGNKVNHSHPYSAKVKNDWSYASNGSVGLHGVDREKLYLYLT